MFVGGYECVTHNNVQQGYIKDGKVLSPVTPIIFSLGIVHVYYNATYRLCESSSWQMKDL